MDQKNMVCTSVMHGLIGKKCVIRGDRSGVYFGEIVEYDGRFCKIVKCRRIWSWSGAASCFQIANDGLRYNGTKMTVAVDEIWITDAREIIPVTEKAEKCLEGCPVWSA